MTDAPAPKHPQKLGVMKAWAMRSFGRENLKLESLPVAHPGPDEVLVRVKAASLNFRDKVVIEGGLLPELPLMPFVPVSDFAGEIAALGSGVEGYAIGDRVTANFRTSWIEGRATAKSSNPQTTLGGPLQGALAQYVCIPASALLRLPEPISFEAAATLPIAALTAWMALGGDDANLQDETVLIEGTGGVSLFALQFALAMGRRPILISRTAEKIERAQKLGAFETIWTEETPHWPDAVRSMTGGHGVDRVIETIGGENVPMALDALAIGGEVVQVGFLAGVEVSFSSVALMLKHATLRGVSVGDRGAFEALLAFMTDRGIEPVIDAIYPFETVHEAFAHLDRGAFGKVVVAIAH